MQETRTWVLAAACLGTFMAILDTSLVNLGLRAIQDDNGASLSALQWVVDAYNLIYAALILTGATLADLYGRRRVFVIGCVTFAFGSAVCALAPNASVLIAGRGVAGAGAALELPAALAILAVAYPDAGERSRAIAIWGGTNGLAMAIGPTLGGLMVSQLGWRSVFYLILPVAALAVVLAQRFVEESSAREGRHLDLSGQAFAIVALTALCFGVIEGSNLGWTSLVILSCFALAVVAAAAFFVVERRSTSPMVPFDVFRNRAFSASVADASLMTFGMYGLLFVVPLYVQIVRGQSPMTAGLVLLPMSVTFFVVSFFAGKLVSTHGPRVAIAGGMTLTGVGLTGLALVGAGTPLTLVIAPLFVVGVGLGLITGPIANAAVANAPAARAGMASGLVNVGRLIGATLGVGVLGIVFGGASKTFGDASGFVAGMRAACMLGAAAQFVGAAIAFVCFREPVRSSAAATASYAPSAGRARSTVPHPRAREMHRASD
jgi:EmrB/QacA subfamily drug resistance transporter